MYFFKKKKKSEVNILPAYPIGKAPQKKVRPLTVRPTVPL